MAATNLLDDPDHINAFLSMIGASPIGLRPTWTAEREEGEKLSSDEQSMLNIKENDNPAIADIDLAKKEMAGTMTPEGRSRAHSTTSSPAVGTKAPPPTPVTTNTSVEVAAKLKPIHEDEADALIQNADESKLGLNDSRFAPKLRYPVTEYRPGCPSTPFYRCGPAMAETSSDFISKTQEDLVVRDATKGYMDQVVSDLKKQSDDIRNEESNLPQRPRSPSTFPHEAATSIKLLGKVSQDVKTLGSQDPADVAAKKSSQSQAQEATIDTYELESVEDRESLTHFKSWGKPETRDKPAARVRRVALSSLPVDADLTLVQSLVHGGAIDDMLLMGASGVAYVRFTSGDACDAYCAKYPNGLPFKYRGRSYTVFVEKCKDVDIIGGVLQGYIDCGASRCVRAIGADEDWTMGGLKKLAEGRTRKGRVENITDVYRNGIRTIVFRFTSITEAVMFKGFLARDEEWEVCNIHFVADPCERATGVHLE